jgi:baculoviral IAP repeat-containing protein 6
LPDSGTDDADASVSLLFSLGSSEFRLHCPAHYPAYRVGDDNFFVEADSGLQLWCNALNEFLLDATGRLELDAILNKGLSLYSSADAAAAANAASNAALMGASASVQ